MWVMSRQVDVQMMRDLANVIAKAVPGVGFALMVFDFHEPWIVNYISNANRDDMILAMEAMVKVLKAKRDFPTPENN